MKKKSWYKVLDATGAQLRIFPTWKQAEEFRCVMGRHDWRIIST